MGILITSSLLAVLTAKLTVGLTMATATHLANLIPKLFNKLCQLRATLNHKALFPDEGIPQVLFRLFGCLAGIPSLLFPLILATKSMATFPPRELPAPIQVLP
jgi:hypothetical protein